MWISPQDGSSAQSWCSPEADCDSLMLRQYHHQCMFCTFQALVSVLLEQILFKVSHEVAMPLICEKSSPRKETVFLFRTSSARRVRVLVIGGRKFVRLLGKCCSASSPSECGMHVYKDVISMVNKYFSWEFGFWLIPSIRLMAWVLSFMYVCSDCTSKCRTSQYSEICSVGQPQAEKVGRPGLLTVWILGSS